MPPTVSFNERFVCTLPPLNDPERSSKSALM
jgi:hypothetical protein